DGADRIADHADLIDQPLLPDDAAGDEVAMPTDIFGEAVEREVRALRERLRPQRPEERVVDRDRRTVVRGEGRSARGGDGLDVDQRIRRIRRAFEVDERDATLALGV